MHAQKEEGKKEGSEEGREEGRKRRRAKSAISTVVSSNIRAPQPLGYGAPLLPGCAFPQWTIDCEMDDDCQVNGKRRSSVNCEVNQQPPALLVAVAVRIGSFRKRALGGRIHSGDPSFLPCLLPSFLAQITTRATQRRTNRTAS